MKGRPFVAMLLAALVAIGAYLVYESQQDDIEIDLPDIEING